MHYIKTGSVFLKIALFISSMLVASEVISKPVLGGQVTQVDRVSQYGITWVFNQNHAVGQFANGDWWVLGPVVITGITPDFDGAQNGWQVNPTPGWDFQGYDSRVPYIDFSTDLVPDLPYTAAPGDSIVKSISGDGRCWESDDPATHPCYLDLVGVLTVVDAFPPDNGATVFRPSFMGNTTKRYYSLSDLRTDLLPSLAPVDDAPTLEEVENNFKRPQLDYTSSWTGRYLHPAQNMSQYGSSIATDTNTAALRLMLNDSIEEKMPALIAYVQTGIDWYHMLDAGTYWPANGGHFVGRKVTLVFTAVMLDNDDMKTAIMNQPINTFSEDGHTYYGANGIALFGQDLSEFDYWRRINENIGARDIRDPYGYVDGGGDEIGSAYQYCCTAQPYKGSALAALLLPQGKSVWNYGAFFVYVDRWVNFGVWSYPDPCALQDPLNHIGNCVSGTGRWINLHNTLADEGNYRHPFVDSMWQAYRGSVINADLIFEDGLE